jgi:PAS domain S-box-containing protein
MKQIRLLLVEDDEEDYELLEETLSEIETFNVDIIWANSYKNALAIIEKEKFDLFFVDYLLGAYSGLELCRQIRESGDITPIILLTGRGDRKVDQEASELGVNDYLVKRNITSTELERSIRYSLKHYEILAALKLSEFKYRAVLTQSQDILFISDVYCNIISVSDSLKTITGFVKEELDDEGLMKLIADKSQKEELKKLLSNKQNIINCPVIIRCRNGELKNVLLTCNYQREYTENDFIHGVIIDKTEEIKALQSRLVNEKLESTARFMRTLAHEVRNPLSNISLAIEGIEAEEEEVSPYVNIIKRNATRIDDIITRVLNSANIEGKVFEHADLIPVLKKTIDNILDKARLKGIALEISLPEMPVYININKEQFSLAVSNLLVNAVEAIEEDKDGCIRIYYSDNKLFISDNGPGISRTDQGHIFEPYYTRKTNGIGLGLASSLSIFRAHQIELELESDLNQGATFILKLPQSETGN